jgi:transcription elongation factor SPT5
LPLEREPDWLLDPMLGQYLQRIKVKVQGTRHANYLDGDYEGKIGRVLGAATVAEGFEHDVTIEFEDGTSRSVLVRYVVPVEPDKLKQQVLVTGGPSKGATATVAGSPDSDMVVLFGDKNNIIEAARHHLLVLYP